MRAWHGAAWTARARATESMGHVAKSVSGRQPLLFRRLHADQAQEEEDAGTVNGDVSLLDHR